MLNLLLVSVLMVFGTVSSQQLTLTVFYESMCPDSRRFIVNQLQPTVDHLRNNLDVQLVPFGKASSFKEINGNYRFECQHGPLECRGNMMQSCALNLMSNRTNIEKVVYVGCEMNTLFGTKGIMQCARNLNIPLSSLQRCITSKQGVDLQLEAESLTNEVKPRFIPTVTINGVFDQKIQDRAQDDLIGTVCDILKDVPNCSYL